MKIILSASQITYYRQNGHIRFDDPPFKFEMVKDALIQTPAKMDLFKNHSGLQKTILRDLGPIALEIIGKSPLRLICDQWIETVPMEKRMQDLFCFQGIVALLALTPSTLDIYEPSCLASLLTPNSYIALLGEEKVRFIENDQDPHCAMLKQRGYIYGAMLRTENHPLIFQ